MEHNISLKPYNTFGLEVKASSFAPFRSVEELKALLKTQPEQPHYILGGGSNVLFTQDYEGLILKNDLKGKEVIKEDDEHVWVKFGAGEMWHETVLYCIENNWAGVENLSLIPGTVGAAPMQNIGAYGVELKDVFDSLEALHKETIALETFDAEACEFGYRSSIFKTSAKDQYVICSVTLRLNKTPEFKTTYGDIQRTLEEMNVKELTIKKVSDAVIHIRQSKLPDPQILGNAGSFFKNPEIPTAEFEKIKAEHPNIPGYPAGIPNHTKVAAGWLIDQAGWKGYKEGHVGVNKKQALVLVNFGGGKGQEIVELAQKIQDSVKEKFAISLHPEVNIVT